MPDINQNIDIKNHGIKLFIAFLAAAIAPAVLCSGIDFFSTIQQTLSGEFLNTPFESSHSPLGVIQMSVALGVVTFVVAFFHVFILGMPLFFLGLRLKMIRWWTTLITAFIVGILPYSLLSGFFTYDNLHEIPPGVLNEFLFLGLFGLSGGITFWSMWRYWVLKKPPINSDETH